MGGLWSSVRALALPGGLSPAIFNLRELKTLREQMLR
jgi:hypothetical protein